MNSHETNHEAVVRKIFDATETGDFSKLDELFVDDCLHHIDGQVAGREGIRRSLADLRLAVPDLKAPIVTMVANGDRMAVQNRLQGTNLGPVGSMPATGKPVDIAVFHFYRFENGKVAEQWAVTDMAALQRQLTA